MTEASVVIACLNAAETLGEALASLAAQQWDRPWEIVFADNGSTDASRAIAEAHARAHPEIPLRILDASERRGKVHALNRGIRAARGRFLVFCDADDAVAPGWLAAMGAALEAHPFVAARMDVTTLNPAWLHDVRSQPQRNGLGQLPYAPFCLYAGGATLGFRREVFEAVGGFDPDFLVLEDTDFCIRAHAAGFGLHFVPDAVYRYRYRTEPAGVYRQARGYAYHRARLRRRYDPASGRWLSGSWLGLAGAFAALGLSAARRRLRRPASASKSELFYQRRRGKAVGDLTGALAFRVAPERRSKNLLRAALRNGLRRGLDRGAGALVGVRTREKLIALTFDDGPDPASTPTLLDLLAARGMKATFFVTGDRAARHSGLLARMVAEGHEIGNHSWDHPSLPTLPLKAAAAQIRRTRAVLAPHGQRFLRPPYGHQTLATSLIARAHGYRVVTWNVSGGDWRGEPQEAILERILDKAAPGAIVLLHDTLRTWEREECRDRRATFDAVAALPGHLAGYRFVTVSELLRHGPPVTRSWVERPKRAWLASLARAEAP